MKWMIVAFSWVLFLVSGSAGAEQKYAFEDICYLSCEESWERAEHSDDNILEMIRVFANFSLKKRGLTFPENEELGRRFGEMIKAICTDEPDDLLFDAVDKSLRRVLLEPKK